ncbi:hypothetical protein LDO26_17705 [Luteimonas sp. BDR2-5]|uniref:hypothetical protein n=1 Tax=Proluteimonas luteida TaxID=2878685 RepID=UPI001E2C515E|nr:hypothetical protein [Luteimonas sp. BDR2-5]MCD9030028.1 hypothetical protein [Luteimonas sp. BDR2-5]
MRYHVLLGGLLALTVLPAAADDRIRLVVPIPVADGADIDPEITDHCGVPAEFTKRLTRELRKVAVPVEAPLDDMHGRVLKVEIVDAVWGGNWFIEHNQTIRVRGVLTRDGAHEAAFNGVMVTRGGGLSSGCYQMNSNFGAMTWYIRRWLRNPVDGARIGMGG